MVVQDIIDIIKEQTRDSNSVTWTLDDIYQYVNEGVKNTIQRAPQANSKKELVPCVAGIEQTLPTDAVSIINVIANELNAQTGYGTIINETDVTAKDAFSPGWRNTTASSIVIEWMKRSSPTKFLIWPPLDAVRNLLVEYSFYPSDVVLSTDSISVTNEYLEPVRDWCLYRTFSRDSEDTPSVQRATTYKQQFESFFQ